MGEILGERKKNTDPNLITHRCLNPEIPDSLSVHSDLSEPRDIKNWFTSYAYESPALDTQEREFENVTVDSEHIEIPSSSCLLSKPSDLSEPPDIANWFSSYVYESPVLDTEEESKFTFTGQNEITKVLDSEKQNQLGTKENCLVKEHSITKFSDDESHKQKLKVGDDLAPLEDNIDSRQNGGDLVKKIDSHVSSPKGLLERKDYDDNAEWKHQRNKPDYTCPNSHKTPLENPVSWSSQERNKVNVPSTNGFISTKKNRYTNENGLRCSNSSQGSHTANVRKTELNLPLKETHVGAGRRPLLERTKLQYEAACPETAGKWRCPQRSKPDLGPPLKQLRLEKWVHRVK